MTATIVAIIITYHPTELCLQNILTYYHAVDELILVDNTEHENTSFLHSLHPYSKIKLIKLHKNLGIGKALNMAMESIKTDKPLYVLTMDQDSSFIPTQFEKYVECVRLLKYENLGMAGVNYEAPIISNPDCTTKAVTGLITSGSIFSSNAYARVGGFNEDFFIDAVDHEYCLRLLKNGFTILQFPNISLQHQLGTNRELRSWGLGKKVSKSIHSPIRLYYITRNYLYLNRQYKTDFPDFCKELKREIGIKLKNGILYEKHKLKYIRYFIKGFLHFRQGIKGKMP